MATADTGPTEFIWRDGKIVPWADATIHVLSHVVHYGSSVFEGMRAYKTPTGGAVFRLQDHMRRLVDSAKIYRFPMKHSADELCQATLDILAANDLKECYLRPVVLRTGEQMAFYPKGVPVETFIICWNMGAYLGADALENGADVCVSTWRRAAPDTFPAMAKAGGNYLNSQLSKFEAKMNDYAEGIMLDSFGYVAEGSGENLFLVRDGVLHTSTIGSGILHGITRDSVMTIATDLGYEVRQGQLPREFLYLADEAFFTGTAAEITPIRSIDRLPVGEGKPGPITKAIQQRFMGMAKGMLDDTHGWLTAVPSHAGAAR
jgi:branched-chain amino acid aminotransferase